MLLSVVNALAQDVSVAQIGDVKYTTLQAAVDEATAGQTIELLKDFELTTVTSHPSQNYNVEINKSITIDGKGYKITSSQGKRPLVLTGEGNNIILKDLTVINKDNVAALWISNALTCTLDNTVIDGTDYAGAYNQVVTISKFSDEGRVVLNVTNGSVIKTNDEGKAHYAIFTNHPTDINVTKSTIKGWAAVYVKSPAAGTNVTISNSTLVSSNAYSNVSNSFAAFVMEDNNVTVNVTNSKITLNNTGDQDQAIAAADGITGAVVNLGEGNEVEFVEPGNFKFALNDAEVKVSGGEFNAPVPEDCCAEGYIPTTLENGKYSVKQGSFVAQIDDVKYETLQAAFNAAKDGETVTLLGNYDATSESMAANPRQFVIKKSITFDGGGYTLTTKQRGIAVGNVNGDLSNDISVTFRDITIKNATSGARCIDTRGKIGTLTLDKVTLNTQGATGYTQPLTIGGNQATPANVIVTNGSVIQTNEKGNAYYAIVTFNPVNMTIEDSTIKGWACIYAKGQDSSAGSAGSTFTINNSTLVSTNEYNGESNSFAAFTMEDNDVTINVTNSEITLNNTGDQVQAIALASRSLTDIAVNLGEGNTVTFDGTGEVAYVLNSPIVKVSGGEFNAPVPEYCCAEGYIPTTLENGKYGVKEGSFVAQIDDVKYETLAAAIAAVPTDDTETTITMLANETVTEELTIATGKNIVLELNGKTISEACSKSGTSALITNNGTLTIQDITDVNKDGSGTGKITYTNGNPDTQSIPGYASNTIINHGSLTLNSGYIENTTNGGYAAYTVDNVTNGNLHTPTFIMSGGKLFNSYTDAVRMFLNSTTNLNKVTISGGILNSDKASGRVVVMHMPSANLGKGELNITGGSINGKVNAWSAANAGGVEDRFSDEQYANVKINITGGNIGSLSFAEMANTELRANSLVVTGGTYEVNPTEYVAEGYEAVDNKNSTWTVGKIVVSEKAFEEAAETADKHEDGSVTYTITPTVADSDGETIGNSTTEEKEITVAISSDETNVAEGASLDNLKMANVLTKAIQTEGAAAADKINVSIAVVAKDKTETAEAPEGTVVFDVHPEATVTVNNVTSSPVELANSDLKENASFTFTLNVDNNKFTEGATVQVVHKSDEFGDETFYKTVSGGKVSITVTHFSIFELSAVPDVVPANISEVGFATFSSTKAVDFTGIDAIHAYTAWMNGKIIEFTRIYKVPANTGLLIRNPNGAKAVSVGVPVIESAPSVSHNDLVPVSENIADGDLPDEENGYSNFILNKVKGVVGFYRPDGYGVDAGRAYLQVLTSSVSGVQSFTNLFDGETTAIDSITTADEQTQDNVFYDLSGRRVNNPQRGLYIVNGKKVLVK